MSPARNVSVLLAPGLETRCEAACRSGSTMSCSAPSPLTRVICTTSPSCTDERGVRLAVDVAAFADIDHLALGDAGAQGKHRVRHGVRHHGRVRRGRGTGSRGERGRRCDQRQAERGGKQSGSRAVSGHGSLLATDVQEDVNPSRRHCLDLDQYIPRPAGGAWGWPSWPSICAGRTKPCRRRSNCVSAAVAQNCWLCEHR